MNYSGIEFLDLDSNAEAELKKVLETLNIASDKVYKIASLDFALRSDVANWCRIPCECRVARCKRIHGYYSKKVYKIAYETSFPYTTDRYYGDDYVRVIKIYAEISRSAYTYRRDTNGNIVWGGSGSFENTCADALSSLVNGNMSPTEVHDALDNIAYVSDIANELGDCTQFTVCDAAQSTATYSYSGSLNSDYYWSRPSAIGTSNSMAGIQYATNNYANSWIWSYSRYDGTHR